MQFLIAYDICDPKRLQRVARRLERYASRCQKSVFVLTGDPKALDYVLNELESMLDPLEDALDAWRISTRPQVVSMHRGRLTNPSRAAVVAEPGHAHFLMEQPS